MRMRQRARGDDGGSTSDPEMIAPVQLAPGWHRDPAMPGIVRYWDGGAWTMEAVDAPQPPQAAPPPVEEPGQGGGSIIGSGADRTPPPAPTAPAPGSPPGGGGGQPHASVEPMLPTPEDVATEAAPDHAYAPHFTLDDPMRGTDPQASVATNTTLVTGQVPRGYRRITLECEKGDVVEATVLDERSGPYSYFVAPVRHRVLRVTATARGGRYGMFIDVDRLEHEEGRS
jgi:hypothetical protein